MNNSKKRPLTAKLRTKNGKYYAVFNCKGNDGKSKAIWKALGLEDKPGNKRRAQDKMEEMKYQLRDVLDVPGYEIPFVDYMRQWKEKKEGEVEESTYQSLKAIVDKKICGYFEPMRLSLSKVKPKHIRQFYEYLYKNGRADGNGGLSISTIKSIKSSLNEAFNKAIIEGLIVNNPVESVKLPAKDNPRKPYTVLNHEGANNLLGHVVDDELMYPLLLTALRYGLRHGEVLGIKWGAVDFEKNLLRIETTIGAGKNPEKNRTKTESSKATFPLLPDVKEAFLIRKNAQDKYRAMYEGAYVETDYVFTRDDGNFLSQDSVRRRFKKILSECGLPQMRFHDLRHSTACILHCNGMDAKELQRWMRHSKIEMTFDVYLHVSKEREDELALGLQNMLSEASEPSKENFIKGKLKLA